MERRFARETGMPYLVVRDVVAAQEQAGASTLKLQPRDRGFGDSQLLGKAQESAIPVTIREERVEQLAMPFALWAQQSTALNLTCICAPKIAVSDMVRYGINA